LRTLASADQIAVFEWGASRFSAWVHAISTAARRGDSEREAFRAARCPIRVLAFDEAIRQYRGHWGL
jgi:hypothetical protein